MAPAQFLFRVDLPGPEQTLCLCTNTVRAPSSLSLAKSAGHAQLLDFCLTDKTGSVISLLLQFVFPRLLNNADILSMAISIFIPINYFSTFVHFSFRCVSFSLLTHCLLHILQIFFLAHSLSFNIVMIS